MESRSEESRRRRAAIGVQVRRICYAGVFAASIFIIGYVKLLVIPDPQKWYANTMGAAGFGLFVSVMLAAMLIPPAATVIYLILWALGIPRAKPVADAIEDGPGGG